MNCGLKSVFEKILKDDIFLKEFVNIDDFDKIYTYCQSKGLNISKNEFDEEITSLISNFSIDSNRLNKKDLEHVAGGINLGKNFNKVIASALSALTIAGAGAANSNFASAAGEDNKVIAKKGTDIADNASKDDEYNNGISSKSITEGFKKHPVITTVTVGGVLVAMVSALVWTRRPTKSTDAETGSTDTALEDACVGSLGYPQSDGELPDYSQIDSSLKQYITEEQYAQLSDRGKRYLNDGFLKTVLPAAKKQKDKPELDQDRIDFCNQIQAVIGSLLNNNKINNKDFEIIFKQVFERIMNGKVRISRAYDPIISPANDCGDQALSVPAHRVTPLFNDPEVVETIISVSEAYKAFISSHDNVTREIKEEVLSNLYAVLDYMINNWEIYNSDKFDPDSPLNGLYKSFDACAVDGDGDGFKCYNACLVAYCKFIRDVFTNKTLGGIKIPDFEKIATDCAAVSSFEDSEQMGCKRSDSSNDVGDSVVHERMLSPQQKTYHASPLPKLKTKTVLDFSKPLNDLSLLGDAEVISSYRKTLSNPGESIVPLHEENEQDFELDCKLLHDYLGEIYTHLQDGYEISF